MIDIHCHLLFGIDDGSKTLENSVRVLSDLRDFGFSDIILTPHYVKETKYASPKNNNIKILSKLKESIASKNININLYLGNEIYINHDILSLLKRGEISSLNNSKYLLIELPLSGEYDGYYEIFLELINHDFKVILAHPERYLSFQKDFTKVLELEELGVYFQSNLESIIDSYGKKAKKLVKRLLKENKITFLATDIHHNKKDYSKYIKAKKRIVKYIGEDGFELLTKTNPLKVLNNKDI